MLPAFLFCSQVGAGKQQAPDLRDSDEVNSSHYLAAEAFIVGHMNMSHWASTCSTQS